MTILTPDFFKRHPADCARDLIGYTFEWEGCAGKIVETEAYAAEDDPACHTFFRPGARRFVAEHPVGTAYIYLNYGVHWLFNILVKDGPMAGFVLFRALEPLVGIEEMRARRPGIIDHQLCAGPGRLTRAFGITGASHGKASLGQGYQLRMGSAEQVIAGGRIGISAAQEVPWRFGAVGSPSLSRKF